MFWTRENFHLFEDTAQQALTFLQGQMVYIETEVYQVQYPELQYATLVPVDTSADEWVDTITFYSLDTVGKADWFHHMAKDMPVADVQREAFEQSVAMAGIGYRYTLQEIMKAQRLGIRLQPERAMAADRAYQEFLDETALRGRSEKGWKGIYNLSGVTVITVPNDGTGSSRNWKDKTDSQIMRDFNGALTNIWTASLTIESADTVLLPIEAMQLLSERRLGETQLTLLDWIATKNIVSLQTNRPITIRAVRGLEAAGVGGVGRMVAYRRDPQVIKMHVPMPHRFLPVWQTGPMQFDIPGIFRTGGTELRRPGAFRYVDAITPAP